VLATNDPKDRILKDALLRLLPDADRTLATNDPKDRILKDRIFTLWQV
jgi:hypothetical protein